MKYTFSSTSNAKLKAAETAKETVIYETETGLFLYDKKDKSTAPSDAVIVSAKGLRFFKQKEFERAQATQPPTVYKNSVQSFTATCGQGFTGSNAVTIAAGVYSSNVSQADADAQALAAATQQAKAGLVCVPVVAPTPTPITGKKGPFVMDVWQGTVKKGSNEIQLDASALNLQVNDKILFEFDKGRGHEAFDNWPDRVVQKLSDLQPFPGKNNYYARVVETGKVMVWADDSQSWNLFDRHGSQDYFAYGWNPVITKIVGNVLTVDRPSPIDYTGSVYFDCRPALQDMLNRNAFDLSLYRLTNSDILYIPFKLDSVNQKNLLLNFDGIQIRSPKGFNTPGIHLNNGNDKPSNNQIFDPNFYCYNGQRKYNSPIKSVLPADGVFMGDPPYIFETVVGIFCTGAKVFNAKVFNAVSYAIEIGDDDTAEDSTISYDETKEWEYFGWPAHIKGNRSWFKGLKFYSPTVIRAYENQQSTDSGLIGGDITNGIISQNSGINGTVKDTTITLKEGAAEADPKIMYETIAQINLLLPKNSTVSGATYENFKMITEGYLTKKGELMSRGFEMKEQSSGVSLLGVESHRPDVLPQFTGNSYARHFGLNADGLKIDGVKTSGKGNAVFGCYDDNNPDNAPFSIYGPGTGAIDNVETQKIVIAKSASIAVGPNVKTDCPLQSV